MKKISVGKIQIDVTLKKIKNLHLSVHPPDGKVTISAPENMDIETVRMYVLGKLNWIMFIVVKVQKCLRTAHMMIVMIVHIRKMSY